MLSSILTKLCFIQKTLTAEFSLEARDFVVKETPQNSLTKFLSEVNFPPPSTPKDVSVPLLKNIGDFEESKSFVE